MCFSPKIKRPIDPIMGPCNATNPYSARDIKGDCGPDAKFFEPSSIKRWFNFLTKYQ